MSARELEDDWMAQALHAAEEAFEAGEEPVGAVVLDAERHTIVARAHQQTVALNDPTAHAVMLALTQLHLPAETDETEHVLREIHGLEPPTPSDKRSLILVTTREPGIMCAGAILLHRAVRQVVYGMAWPAFGGCGSALNVLEGVRGRSVRVKGGVRQAECKRLWDRFDRRRSAQVN